MQLSYSWLLVIDLSDGHKRKTETWKEIAQPQPSGECHDGSFVKPRRIATMSLSGIIIVWSSSSSSRWRSLLSSIFAYIRPVSRWAVIYLTFKKPSINRVLWCEGKEIDNWGKWHSQIDWNGIRLNRGWWFHFRNIPCKRFEWSGDIWIKASKFTRILSFSVFRNLLRETSEEGNLRNRFGS